MAKNKILVPVDGSACSISALEYAARRRAVEPGTEILVANVQPSLRPSRTLTRALIAEHQQRSAAEALEPVYKALKRLKLEAACHTLIGDPAETIVAFAKKKKCTEIAMGNNGRGAISGWVMGSVARKVVFLATVPVVLVK